jgi:hypothetical protein
MLTKSSVMSRDSKFREVHYAPIPLSAWSDVTFLIWQILARNLGMAASGLTRMFRY